MRPLRFWRRLAAFVLAAIAVVWLQAFMCAVSYNPSRTDAGLFRAFVYTWDNALIMATQWALMREATGAYFPAVADDWKRSLAVSIVVVPALRAVAVGTAPEDVHAHIDEYSAATRVVTFLSLLAYYASLVWVMLVTKSAIEANGRAVAAAVAEAVAHGADTPDLKQRFALVSRTRFFQMQSQSGTTSGDGRRSSNPAVDLGVVPRRPSRTRAGVQVGGLATAPVATPVRVKAEVTRRRGVTLMRFMTPAILLFALIGRQLGDTFGQRWFLQFISPLPILAWAAVCFYERHQQFYGEPFYALGAAFGLVAVPYGLGSMFLGQLKASGDDSVRKFWLLAVFYVLVFVLNKTLMRSSQVTTSTGSAAAMFILYFSLAMEVFLELVFVNLEPFSASFFVVLVVSVAKNLIINSQLQKDMWHSVVERRLEWRPMMPDQARDNALFAEVIIIADTLATLCVVAAVVFERVSVAVSPTFPRYLTGSVSPEDTNLMLAAYALVVATQLAASSVVRRLHAMKVAAAVTRANPGGPGGTTVLNPLNDALPRPSSGADSETLSQHSKTSSSPAAPRDGNRYAGADGAVRKNSLTLPGRNLRAHSERALALAGVERIEADRDVAGNGHQESHSASNGAVTQHVRNGSASESGAVDACFGDDDTEADSTLSEAARLALNLRVFYEENRNMLALLTLMAVAVSFDTAFRSAAEAASESSSA